MKIEQLIGLGLTKPQAKAYFTLLKHGRMTPPMISKEIEESRTNTYSVLDKLVELKLAILIEGSKKQYEAANPAHLEDFVKKQKLAIIERENSLNRLLPEMMQMYFKIDSEPGIRFFRGKKEIKKIYQEQIDDKKPIYLVRSPADLAYYGFEYLNAVRLGPANYGIQRYGLVPDLSETNPTKAKDKASNLERTWVHPDDYNAKVEWTIFGDKVSAISFGKEGVGMIIESPQIAESMRQIFELAKAGAKARYPKPKYGYKKEN